MAGPEIKVSFLSDFSRFKQGVSDVSSSAKTAGSGLKDAFAPALSILNRSGVLGPFQDAISGVGDAIASVKEHINDLPLALAGAGAAVAGIGVALSLVGSKDKQAHQQLQASVEATGKSYDDYAAQVDQAIKHQEKFGNTAATTQDALRILTQATGDPTKALQYLNTATDLAAAKHESLTAAAGQLGKAYNGAGRLLKEFGLDAAPKAATATKALESATKAAAAADAASATAKQHLGDVMALLSSKGKISIADQIKLRDAQQAVAKAQEDVAHHVKGSTDELAKAQQKLGDTQAIVGGKARLSAADQIKLRDAQQNVAKAAATAKAAHEKMAGASDLAKKAASGQADTMTALSGKLKGQASAAADTFGGKLKELKARAEDSIATFGQKYGAALPGHRRGDGWIGWGHESRAGRNGSGPSRRPRHPHRTHGPVSLDEDSDRSPMAPQHCNGRQPHSADRPRHRCPGSDHRAGAGQDGLAENRLARYAEGSLGRLESNQARRHRRMGLDQSQLAAPAGHPDRPRRSGRSPHLQILGQHQGRAAGSLELDQNDLESGLRIPEDPGRSGH